MEPLKRHRHSLVTSHGPQLSVVAAPAPVLGGCWAARGPSVVALRLLAVRLLSLFGCSWSVCSRCSAARGLVRLSTAVTGVLSVRIPIVTDHQRPPRLELIVRFLPAPSRDRRNRATPSALKRVGTISRADGRKSASADKHLLAGFLTMK